MGIVTQVCLAAAAGATAIQRQCGSHLHLPPSTPIVWPVTKAD